jgi:Flp pilus assembly pilin Flp
MRFDGKKRTRGAQQESLERRERGTKGIGAVMKTNQTKVLSLSPVRGRSRGASMVEYALLLVAVLVLSAVAFKSLGEKIKTSVSGTAELF